MRRENLKQIEFVDFVLPFGGQLNAKNRWVQLAQLVPWQQVQQFYDPAISINEGAPSKSARIAFGALLIKERLGLSDREVVEQITENPYLQYFLGLGSFQVEPLFDPSLMTHFRKRFSKEGLCQINELIVNGKTLPEPIQEHDDQDKGSSNNSNSNTTTQQPSANEPSENKGTLIVDATCAPADIRYPTDLSLLGQAREKSEAIIDALFLPLQGTIRKPRTYRKNARKKFTAAIKKRNNKSGQGPRKAIGQQLRYLRRNLGTIDTLLDKHGQSLLQLDRVQYRELLIIQELYRQQDLMYSQRKHTVDNRIVSISQPHVRPIIRGKAGAKVEFGAKISVGYRDGYCFVENLSWDAYNECHDLMMHVENYNRRYGYYPERVCADSIYRTRSNRNWCTLHGIRLSGRGPGRPPKDAAKNKAQRQINYEDELARIPIEGKFGQAKRRFGLDRIMSKLAQSSVTSILMTFITMNLDRRFFVPNLLAFFGLSRGFVRIVDNVIARLKHLIAPWPRPSVG